MAEENSELNPEICVIGAGAGGLAAAAAAAAMGVSVVLIEKDRMGGKSLYAGSVPARALQAAAAHANAVRVGASFGVKSVRSGIDFAAVNAHVRRAVEAIAPQNAPERFRGLGVRVIAGAARFKDAGAVVAGATTVRARHFIIATGSTPVIPPIPGLADTPYLTPENIFDLADCPRHLLILGAGRTGLELGQTFRRLGSEVTVFETVTPLRHEDRECAAIILEALGDEGVRLRSGVQIAQIRRVLARIQAVIANPTKPDGAGSAAEEVVEGSHILLATGRRPNIGDLDLDAAGIRHDENRIVVDRRLRTTNKNVYAIGDVIGRPRYAHAASYQAGLVVRNVLFRQALAVDSRAVPRVIFTDPELAQVGLLEDEARELAKDIRILRWPYRENDRALTAGASNGHIKVITDAKGEVLGASIAGAQAGEGITTWALAISQKLNIAALAGLVVPYPTYGEVGKRAAITYFMRGLTNTRVRRIMGWLRRRG
jgi:pyruvate/2-oxoglutarate dehydrogenase complex dihydrolipoamide dehydrogenase (E3) component